MPKSTVSKGKNITFKVVLESTRFSSLTWNITKFSSQEGRNNKAIKFKWQRNKKELYHYFFLPRGLLEDSCEIQNPHENEIFIYSKFSVQKFSPYLLKSLFIHWYQSIHRRGCMWFFNIITIIKQGFMSVMGRFYLTTKSRKQFTVCKWYWAADSKWNFLKCQMNIVEVFEIESSSEFLH